MLISSDIADRNTPTGVGKTEQVHPMQARDEKHPHGRGEDLLLFNQRGGPVETPPRAWGRPLGQPIPGWTDGNTPTGVGKTPMILWRPRLMWKHPHGRGEDSSIFRIV